MLEIELHLIKAIYKITDANNTSNDEYLDTYPWDPEQNKE